MYKCASNEQFLIVSDGSLCDTKLSYGWVFGTASGTIYAEHSGRGYGTATSHRAEAWGMLSATVFLYHVLEYTKGVNDDYTRSYPVQFSSDNSGLIQRITTRHKYTTPFPNSTLEPDWEIVEQIYETVKNIHGIRIQYEWVRGHQDDTTADLSMVAN